MHTIHGKVTEGRVNVAVPPDWQEGTSVTITPEMPANERVGMREDEWRDDAQARTEWAAWSKTFEPVELTSDEEQALRDFRARVKAQSIEAVRASHGGRYYCVAGATG